MEKLNEQARIYFDLQAQIEALQAEAEAIKESMKSYMIDHTTEDIRGDGWSATWHNTVTNRFDSSAFRKEHGELYTAFCKPVNGTRFTLQTVKA